MHPHARIGDPGRKSAERFVRCDDPIRVDDRLVHQDRPLGSFSLLVGLESTWRDSLTRSSNSANRRFSSLNSYLSPASSSWVMYSSLSHQLMPISRALSTDATIRRILIVSSSISRRRIWISPTITIPLSSTRSKTSARLSLRGCVCRLGVPRPAGTRCSPLASLLTLDSFGLRTHIAPKPPELYDLPVFVDINLIAGEHVARFWNALHLKDLNLDNPPIVIASNPRNPFRGTSDKLG